VFIRLGRALVIRERHRPDNRFFAWCEHHQLGGIDDIEPLHVAAYIEALGKDFEKPTVKQHLAAIRMLFDWLVTGQVLATNPAHAVRGPKHVVKTGKTTVLDAEQARTLLDRGAAVWTVLLPDGEPLGYSTISSKLAVCPVSFV